MLLEKLLVFFADLDLGVSVTDRVCGMLLDGDLVERFWVDNILLCSSIFL